jgi:hypothetical protein
MQGFNSSCDLNYGGNGKMFKTVLLTFVFVLLVVSLIMGENIHIRIYDLQSMIEARTHIFSALLQLDRSLGTEEYINILTRKERAELYQAWEHVNNVLSSLDGRIETENESISEKLSGDQFSTD